MPTTHRSLCSAPAAARRARGRQWVYLRDERPHAGPALPVVLYCYTPDRKGAHPQAELADFRSLLYADGYSGFNKLYKAGPGGTAAIAEVACWAHVRRKIHDVHVATKSPIAAEALELIGALFDVERDIAGAAAEERLRVRTARSLPALEAVNSFFDDHLRRLPSKSDLATAMRYALAGADPLCRGRPLRDQQQCRRAGHPPMALGRKNWLFAGSAPAATAPPRSTP